jgi:hypothetical protein
VTITASLRANIPTSWVVVFGVCSSVSDMVVDYAEFGFSVLYVGFEGIVCALGLKERI